MVKSGNNTNRGFTLVEMMVVVVILALFAGMTTLSVGSTEVRKNRAFYEHLSDSLAYVRLVAAEQMQPMGLVLRPDKQGKVQPVIMRLDNPYLPLTTATTTGARADTHRKNNMELSAMSVTGTQQPLPEWVAATDLELPELPPNVTIDITALDAGVPSVSAQAQQLQPWFVGQQVPQVLWFGTGAAAPARIEVRYNTRLVGDALVLLPDGRLVVDR